MNSEEISDTTTVYVRVNKFTPNAEGWKTDPECADENEINLDCLELTDCDLPGGDIFISGVFNNFGTVVGGEVFEVDVPLVLSNMAHSWELINIKLRSVA